MRDFIIKYKLILEILFFVVKTLLEYAKGKEGNEGTFNSSSSTYSDTHSSPEKEA